MSAAIRAKTAKTRAAIAARLLKTIKPYGRGYGLGRSFDNCFEMGDGEQVSQILKAMAAKDMVLLHAMLYVHGCKCGHWGKEILDQTGINPMDLLKTVRGY